MSEYVVAAPEGSWFHFDGGVLAGAVVARWPGGELVVPQGSPPGVDWFYYLPRQDGLRRTEIGYLSGGTAIVVEAGERAEAAEIVAWLCGEADLPDDGRVLLCEWADAPVPLRPATTAEDLLALT